MLNDPAVSIAKVMNAIKELLSTDSIDTLPYCCPSNMITSTQLRALVKYGCNSWILGNKHMNIPMMQPGHELNRVLP